jgi:multicomponent Na+:H+ antiporter subunit B
VTARGRTALFLVAAAVAGVVLVTGYSGLPDFGGYHGVYGMTLQLIAVPQRHATDVVTAVNFDYRAFDTLGEEFILLAAVAGCAALLRHRRAERGEAKAAPVVEPAAIVRWLSSVLVGPMVVLALYLAAHGHLTPGGGFAGGVVGAGALLLAYAGGQAFAAGRLRAEPVLEAGEALGALAFVVLGFVGLVWGSAALQNVLGLGSTGELFSSGTIPIANLAVGLEVVGGVALILSEFVDQALLVRRSRRP